uniref:Uncharacterized protein n=1 Tax=Caenorhabditis japonica TaxID=281687 RepID=A0A8R1HR33_CAEJA
MQARGTACQSLLLTPQRKEFLADFVTEDESWVLYNNDTHRAVWIPRGEEPPVQPKANLHQKKCLLSCFWDAKGMLYNRVAPARVAQVGVVAFVNIVMLVQPHTKIIRENKNAVF